MQCLEFDYFVLNKNYLAIFPPIIMDVFGHYDKLFDRTPFFQCRSIIRPELASLKMLHLEQGSESDQEGEIPKEPSWHPCFRYGPEGQE